jgi:hypothetical protein
MGTPMAFGYLIPDIKLKPILPALDICTAVAELIGSGLS